MFGEQCFNGTYVETQKLDQENPGAVWITFALPAHLRSRAPVMLMYHSVVENPQLTENSIGTSKSSAVFEAHIRMLVQRFTPVSLDQVVEFAAGGKELPPSSVAVTFDDGFLDNLDSRCPF